MTLNCAPLPQHGKWPCCGIGKKVSLTGPQPWDVVCKSKHHPECVVLPTTLGNVPVVMPRYYCRGRSHDNSTLYLADTGVFLGRVLFQVTQAGDSFGIVLTRTSFFYILACVFIYIILYVCFLLHLYINLCS